MGKKPPWGPIPDTLVEGPHIKPSGCPRGAADMAPGTSRAVSAEAGLPRFSARPFPLRRVQRAQQSGVQDFFPAWPGNSTNQLPDFPPIKSTEFPFIKLFPNKGCPR